MKKEIDLFKLQTIPPEKTIMKDIDKFRCKGCNKPIKSLLDAYSCGCQKKAFWPTSKNRPLNLKKVFV